MKQANDKVSRNVQKQLGTNAWIYITLNYKKCFKSLNAFFFFLTPRIVEKIQEETNRRFWDSWQVLSCSASKVKSFSKCFGYLAALRHPRWVEPCWIMPWEPRTPLPHTHPPTWGSFLVGSTCHGLMPKLSFVLLHWGERSNNLFLMWSCCIRHCKATHRFNVNPKKKKSNTTCSLFASLVYSFISEVDLSGSRKKKKYIK